MSQYIYIYIFFFCAGARVLIPHLDVGVHHIPLLFGGGQVLPAEDGDPEDPVGGGGQHGRVVGFQASQDVGFENVAAVAVGAEKGFVVECWLVLSLHVQCN